MDLNPDFKVCNWKETERPCEVSAWVCAVRSRSALLCSPASHYARSLKNYTSQMPQASSMLHAAEVARLYYVASSPCQTEGTYDSASEASEATVVGDWGS